MAIVNATGDTLPEAYERALYLLENYGDVKYNGDWGVDCKELNLCMTVNDPLKEPMISMLTVATPESLQKYLMEMLDGLLDWSIGIETDTGVLEPYTYHERIMRQWDGAINELRRNKHTRRACISVRTQEDVGSPDPACLQHIQFMINHNRLDMHVMFRSNDACRAAFMNAFALIMLQESALVELNDTYPNLKMGKYVHHANNFHAYADSNCKFQTLEAYVKRIDNATSAEINRADYTGEWEEMMEEYTDKITRENDAKKAQYGF